jgi:hypothetical protein
VNSKNFQCNRMQKLETKKCSQLLREQITKLFLKTCSVKFKSYAKYKNESLYFAITFGQIS